MVSNCGGKTKMKFLHLCWWLESHWESTCVRQSSLQTRYKVISTEGRLQVADQIIGASFSLHVSPSASPSLSLAQDRNFKHKHVKSVTVSAVSPAGCTGKSIRVKSRRRSMSFVFVSTPQDLFTLLTQVITTADCGE